MSSEDNRLSENALRVLEKRYLKKDMQGQAMERPDELFRRVAKNIAQADKIIPMSTRQGQYISLRDIIQAVGKDAARFFFLMRKRDSHLHFEM